LPNSLAPAHAHWSKDFVEHLRTVHFSLLVISAGLIVLVLSSKEYNAVAALVQIDEVIDLRHQWSTEWVEEQSKDSARRTDEIPEGVTPMVRDIRRDEIPSVQVQYAANKIGGPIHILTFDCSLPKDNSYQRSSQTLLPLTSFPRTLAGFRLWWNQLLKPHDIVFPKEFSLGSGFAPYIQYSSDTPKYYRIDIHLASDFVRNNSADRIKKQLSIHEEGKGFAYWFDFVNEEQRFLTAVLPVYVVEQEVSQQTLLKNYTNLKSGVFEKSFADLASATQGQGDLPLEDIKNFLHDEASKGPEVFEAFGMKFPAGQITFWGVVLLLSVQLYFLVYLRQLLGKLKPDDPGWDVPWIGMDSSPLSNAILYVSLVILPCIAAILLSWQATVRLSSGYWERSEHWYDPVHFLAGPWHWHYTVLLKIFLLILAAVASGYLGFLSWKYRPQVVPEAPSCPSQLFE
jgi:hypothetical protein